MRRYRMWFFGALTVAAICIGTAVGLLMVKSGGLPEIAALEEYKPSATTRLYADDGQLIAEFYLENRTPVTLDRVPRQVINAFISSEDPRFYHHPGIDMIGIIRAFAVNLRAHRVVQGGSSITQQLAKMLFLVPEKSYTRKLKEAMLALQIERRYSKDEILNLYLNQVYFGSGAYGIEAASNVYFGKPAAQLTLSEGALLAGLGPAPNRWSPYTNPAAAAARRRHVLRRMLEEGYITRLEMETALNIPLGIRPGRFVSAHAPYFVEYLRQGLEGKYGTGALYSGGLNVYTTLNMKMQDMAEAALKKRLAEVAKRHPRKGAEIQGALLAIEPHMGYIKAMVGGTDFSKSQFNRAIQALRQPGSAFKPIVYAAALDKGYQPDDVVMDGPVSYPGASPGERWRPSNYDNKFEGPITLRRALARSVNVVAVRLLDDVGIPLVMEYAARLGIHSKLEPYLPLALGASDVTLIEMTSAFAAFDNDGIYTEPMAVKRITDREGRLLEERTPRTSQAVSPDTAASMTDLLEGVIQHGTGWQAKALGRPAAGKTGTTSDFKDAWFVGYLPSMVVGVWVGYDDHKPIGSRETGARAALPIWLDFMQGYVKQCGVSAEEFPAPSPPVFTDNTGLRLKLQGVEAAPVQDLKEDEAPSAGAAVKKTQKPVETKTPAPPPAGITIEPSSKTTR